VTIPIPVLDNRSFDQLVAEAKARIAVHTPEWTNLNDSDPGIAIVEVFAFLTENLLYRSNRIPEANRIKFLTMLGVSLQPASPGHGLVAFSNDRGPLQPLGLTASTEVRSGQVPFLVDGGLAVQPVTAAAYYKAQQKPDAATQAQYNLLYQTFLDSPSDVLTYYQPTSLDPPATGKPDPVVDLGDPVNGTIDRSLWLAVLAPPLVDPEAVRAVIGGQTLSIGVYPATQTPGQVLAPMTTGGPGVDPGLVFEIAAPAPDPTGNSGPGYGIGPANYVRLPVTYADPVLQAPGVVQVTLPPYQQLLLWNFDPEEEGTGDYPPRLDDATISSRLVTWIRLRYPPLPDTTTASTSGGTGTTGTASNGTGNGGNGSNGGCGCTGGCGCLGGASTASTTSVLAADAVSDQKTGRLTWVGLNAATVVQAVPVNHEIVGTGTGTPFQTFAVANAPVVTDATGFLLEVQGTDGWAAWQQIDDIYAAAAGATAYMLDPASGLITGGSGLFGARFPAGATVRATYRYGGGQQGQVAIGAINKSATLPGGFSVSNPVPTWGASDAESASDGEANITRWLRHRDRLVTADDFADVTRRAPGIDLGRVEVLPLFNPDGPDPAATWPGMVTVLVIPRSDPVHPNAPVPDLTFLNAVCGWLDPRRLITTEVHVRGPVYQQIWVSVGIEVLPGQVFTLVQQAVTAAVQSFLSPLTGGLPAASGSTGILTGSSTAPTGTGWPLGTAVRSQDIEAVATRVPGVRYVDSVLIAGLAADGSMLASLDPVPIAGLQLPAATVYVSNGPAEAPSTLIGGNQGTLPTQVPVPVVPPVC
jgi:predicted phage baseplate assembly protein